jgi:hypothetical protein
VARHRADENERASERDPQRNFFLFFCLAALEAEDGYLPEVKVDKVLRLVRHVRAKVAAGGGRRPEENTRVARVRARGGGSSRQRHAKRCARGGGGPQLRARFCAAATTHRPTMTCHVGPYFLSNSFLMSARGERRRRRRETCVSRQAAEKTAGAHFFYGGGARNAHAAMSFSMLKRSMACAAQSMHACCISSLMSAFLMMACARARGARPWAAARERGDERAASDCGARRTKPTTHLLVRHRGQLCKNKNAGSSRADASWVCARKRNATR